MVWEPGLHHDRSDLRPSRPQSRSEFARFLRTSVQRVGGNASGFDTGNVGTTSTDSWQSHAPRGGLRVD